MLARSFPEQMDFSQGITTTEHFERQKSFQFYVCGKIDPVRSQYSKFLRKNGNTMNITNEKKVFDVHISRNFTVIAL